MDALGVADVRATLRCRDLGALVEEGLLLFPKANGK
jgi:hypothetical protein